MKKKEEDPSEAGPVTRSSLLALWATREPLEEEFPDIDDLPPLDDVNL